MNRLKFLIDTLKEEYEIPFNEFDHEYGFDTFRYLVNIRQPKSINEEFLNIQNEFLQEIISQKGITNIEELKPVRDHLYLWQGDITTLNADAIVNAANSGMLGCFYPCHGCIDNAIHTYAGVQLRLECADIMRRQADPEETGTAKITNAYNLPSKYVIHTVGPIISRSLTKDDCELLANCYRSCLELAEENGIKSIAFCCISTGEFHFPNKKAAEIAINTVCNYIQDTNSGMKVIFNVFKKLDFEIYQELLR